VKLFIAFEAIGSRIVLDPFFLGTEGSFEYFFDLFVHINNNIFIAISINIFYTKNKYI